ncbi:MAG TPA: hypothetical protein VI454_13075 [Verrucomicrobiae bacterium]|jgi:hypothetical protein
MDTKKLEQVIAQVESYVECWRQFSHYLNRAREKRFDLDDETQFLEFKCVLIQELESILATIEMTEPSKEEIHGVITNCSSIRAMSGTSEQDLAALENQWHKIYIAWHSILGQLKASLRQQDEGKGWSLFAKKAA